MKKQQAIQVARCCGRESHAAVDLVVPDAVGAARASGQCAALLSGTAAQAVRDHCVDLLGTAARGAEVSPVHAHLCILRHEMAVHKDREDLSRVFFVDRGGRVIAHAMNVVCHPQDDQVCRSARYYRGSRDH